MTPVPFVIGQWVRGERFYGRGRLIAEILDGPRDGLWLLGTRRIGKTSLLKQLELLAATASERSYSPLFWDLQGADDPAELHAGFVDALLDAEDRLAEIDVDAAEIEAADLFTVMSRLRRRLRARKLRLLLLCDEVEELIKLNDKDPALLGKLRHALQASEDVRAVLASTIRLWALAEQRADTSPFLHGFAPPLYIGTMSDDGARALLRQRQQPAELRPGFTDDEIETIRQRCDNHPYLLQLVGKRLLESGDLEEAIEEVAADQMVGYFFSVDFEMLSSIEQEILRTVARDTPAASDTLEGRLALDAPTLQSALQNLHSLGFVRRDPERRVVLANYFFRRWLTGPMAGAGSSFGPSDSNAPFRGEAASDRRRSALGSLLEGRYELRRKAGEGATGFVFEAWDRLLETRIAVKLLRREYAGNSLVLERFRQEILLSRNLAHPNILRVYHLGHSEDRAYLTMQWIDGPTLAAVITEEAPLPAERVAFLGARLASALEAAHGHNVLHRDVKPHNVLLDRSGQPLITDFGLARLLEGPGVTTAGVFLGTPNYVSPEQSRLEPLDGRSDVYSLGVVLFEMATGRCPFLADTAGEVLEMHRKLAPPDPRDVAPDVPPELARIILACLEKDREARIGGAGELRRELEALLPPGSATTHRAAVISRHATVTKASATTLGDGEASRHASAEELIPLVYDELRRLARGFLARERPDHTLQPTALVHEAYLRLAKQQAVEWAGRTHFFAVGANIMRRLLIDHARTRGRQKRGGELRKVTLQEAITPGGGRDLGFDELLSLDAALAELAAVNPRQAAIVELRFFGGLTVAEVAEHLGLSKRTVEGDWTAAREWLRQRLAAETE
jgi:RNA polymerase sigma factor (TIGR02999 family)